MQLTRLMQSAGLALLATCCLIPSYSYAQTVSQAPLVQTDIQPYLAFGVGPAPLKNKRYNHGGTHPGFDITAGARKRITGVFGVVASANYGKMLDVVLGGEDAVCLLRQDGQPGCRQNSPILDWFGASVGGEAYFGRAIFGLQFGPTSVSVPVDERDLMPGSPNREWGVRSQFDVNFPVYRQLGITLAAADRYVPNILNDHWHITSVSVGLTLREFHK